MSEKEDIFKDGIKGGHDHHVTGINIGSIFSKFSKPLLVILLLIAIFSWGYYEKDCPVCEVCKTCTVCENKSMDCSSCPKEVEKVNVIKYACSNGLIVDNLKECTPISFFGIESEYKIANQNITFSIDKLEYTPVGSYYRITEIDYTIINTGEHDIKPVVLVNLYSPEDEKIEQGVVHEIFDDNEFLGPGEWTIKKKNTDITFIPNDSMIRLILKDKVPDPDKELIRLTRPIINP